MNQEEFKNLSIEVINSNTKAFIEMIELIDTPFQKEIIEFSKTNKNVFDFFVMLVLTSYSLTAFNGTKTVRKDTRTKIQELVVAHPILKECLSSYLQLVKVIDINPSLSPKDAIKSQKNLEEILLS